MTLDSGLPAHGLHLPVYAKRVAIEPLHHFKRPCWSIHTQTHMDAQTQKYTQRQTDIHKRTCVPWQDGLVCGPRSPEWCPVTGDEDDGRGGGEGLPSSQVCTPIHILWAPCSLGIWPGSAQPCLLTRGGPQPWVGGGTPRQRPGHIRTRPGQNRPGLFIFSFQPPEITDRGRFRGSALLRQPLC